MLPAVAALMGTQRGLVLRRQVLAAGVAQPLLDQLVRRGDWVVVRRGVYTTRTHWESLDRWRGRPLLCAYAASLNMSMPHVLSHESSALAQDLPILMSDPLHVHICRFGHIGCRTKHGVCHHQAPFEPWQIVEVDGVPMLDKARTAVDIARSRSGLPGLRHGIVACDSALRAGVRRALLEEALVPMRCWPNVTVARTCVAMADGESDSVAESLGRLLVVGLGVGEVHTQFGLRDGEREAWVDLRVGRHLIEVDGLVKYTPVEDGGVADRDPRQVLWEEKRRQEWLCGFRLGMSRLVWQDLTPAAWRRTEHRLAGEIGETRARWGDDISDLEPYLHRGPRRRPTSR